MTTVTRWLRAYSFETDDLVAEWRLPPTMSLSELQALAGAAASDPMYDCYPLSKDAFKILESRLGIRLMPVGAAFFLEADSE